MHNLSLAKWKEENRIASSFICPVDMNAVMPTAKSLAWCQSQVNCLIWICCKQCDKHLNACWLVARLQNYIYIFNEYIAIRIPAKFLIKYLYLIDLNLFSELSIQCLKKRNSNIIPIFIFEDLKFMLIQIIKIVSQFTMSTIFKNTGISRLCKLIISSGNKKKINIWLVRGSNSWPPRY